MSLLRRMFYKNRKFYDDDFDWENYTSDSYARRLERDVESRYQARGAPEDVTFDDASGELVTGGVEMHPNHTLILEAIGRLKPGSVHEVGCGGGDHVARGQQVFPAVTFSGGDRAQSQLNLALSRHPALEGRLGIQDITMPFSSAWPEADLVYTQAVIMHIHTAVSHLVALSNLVRSARRYVLMVENLQCHNFLADVRSLADGGHLSWDDVHAYRFDGSAGARAILLSREPLDLPPAEDDAAMRKGLKVSDRRLKRANEDSARGLFGFQGS